MNELVEIIRGELTEVELVTIGSLIVLDVHEKDVVKDLVKLNINSLESFEWVCQLRYYFSDNTLLTEK
jgi:dynein heavy chain